MADHSSSEDDGSDAGDVHEKYAAQTKEVKMLKEENAALKEEVAALKKRPAGPAIDRVSKRGRVEKPTPSALAHVEVRTARRARVLSLSLSLLFPLSLSLTAPLPPPSPTTERARLLHRDMQQDRANVR